MDEIGDTSTESLKGRDLSPAVIAQAKAPKPTWFVERTGDRLRGKESYIFACEEHEAWNILNDRSEWKRHDFMFVGFSDGKTYKKICDEAMSGAAEIEPKITALKIEIGKYRAAEEKLIISEAVDMDGEPTDVENESNKQKVIRLRKILEKLDTKLEGLETELRTFSSGIVKRATAAELDVAIANWKIKKVWPGKMNVYTPGASSQERDQILNSMKA